MADGYPPGLRITLVGINHAPETTGIAPYTTAMARALAAAGHRVRVVTSMPHYPGWRIAADYRPHRTLRQLVDGVRVLRLRHYVPRHPTVVTRSLMEIAFGLRAVVADWGRPDVVVLVSPALLASWLLQVRARLVGLPVIVWMQDIYTLGVAETGTSSRLAGPLRHVESGLLRRSQGVVAIHDRFRRYLVDALGVPSHTIAVVRNWSHVPSPTPNDRERAAVRARLGWGRDETVVLHAGNMGAKQGLENVVAAARLATERGAPVRFVLLGDGHRRQDLQRLAAGDPRLQFLDPVPDAEFTATLAAADVLLVNELPGLTEMSVPSKLTSYFATGLPVLGAVDPGSTTAEELAAAGAPPPVPAGDPEALVGAVEELRADPDRCGRLGSAARDFRTRMLSEEHAVTRFTAVVRSVVAAAPRRDRRRQPMRIWDSDAPEAGSSAQSHR